ncbi:MAG: serine/threonine-protein kinase, partial [Myxococcota bacterium]
MSDASEYERLMAAFDELVEVGPSERARRLEMLRAEDPILAAHLAKLLDADEKTFAPLERAVEPSRIPGFEAHETSPASARPLPVELGTAIGLYRLTEVIGRGGMGCVYRAEHVHLPRVAAIKILEPRLIGDANAVSRFLHEAKIVSAIRHPNIVDVFDFIETEAPHRVAFVMELLKGSTLAETLAEGVLSLNEALSVCLQLCGALATVHERGVVHRDLKPENVMVVGPLAEEDTPSVKLLDFGIAKVPNPDSHRTATGVMMGTPRYMAPEQFATEAPTPATDVYALAELTYEMLTGQPVFPELGLPMMRRKMASASDLVLPDNIPHRDRLRRLLQDCLQAEPSVRPSIDRFEQTLIGLRGAVNDVVEPPPRARPRIARIGVRLFMVVLFGLWFGPTHRAPMDSERVVHRARLPAVIYGEPPNNTPYVPTGFMGDLEALRLDAAWIDNPRSGSTCLRVTFAKTTGWAGLAWLHPQDDWGDRPGGLAMTGASRLSWWARSDIEGLEVRVGYGLLLKSSHAFYDSDRDERVFYLTSNWREYVFDLRGKDLSRIKNPFYFALGAPTAAGSF